MGYINVKPPLSKAQIDTMRRGMEQDATHNGVVLSYLVYVCYARALKKNQLIKLTCGNTLTFPNHVKAHLQSYLNYLNGNQYRMTNVAPLFPDPVQKNNPYSGRNLQNHLRRFFLKQPFEVSLETIRKAGICRHYNQLRQKKTRPDQCLVGTMKFAKISMKQTLGILRGNIQPTGKKTDPFRKYLKMIEEEITVRKGLGSVEAIRQKIEMDGSLKDEEKEVLKSNLENRVLWVKERSNPKAEEETLPQYTSLTEAIKHSK